MVLERTVGKGTLFARCSTCNSSLNNYASEHPFKDGQSTEAVHVNTIDNYCAAEGVGQIDLLKIDAEGLDFERALRRGRNVQWTSNWHSSG